MDSGRALLLYEIAQRLASLIEIDELLPYLNGRIKELLHAASAALRRPEGDELRFTSVDDDDPAKVARLTALRLPKDRGVAGWVLTHAEPVLGPDVAADARWYSGVDQTTGRATRDIIC